jgi:hypothetical protein
MKKNLLFLALAMFCFVGMQAQKQVGGDKVLELNVAPLGGTPVGLSSGGLLIRMFTDETTCLRAGIFLGGSTDKVVTAQPNTLPEIAPDDDRLNPELYDISKAFDLSIQPGIELHMDGTDRLSPYIGGMIDFGMGSTSMESEMWNANDIDNLADFEKYVVWSFTEKDSYTRFGVFAIAGTDFYFADNIYFGFEMGFGFSSMSYGDTEYETSDQVAYSLYETGGSDDNVDLPSPLKNDKMSAWGPTVNGRFRVGWILTQ